MRHFKRMIARKITVTIENARRIITSEAEGRASSTENKGKSGV